MIDYRAELLAAALREIMRRTGLFAHVSARSGEVRVFGTFGKHGGWVHEMTYPAGSLFCLRRAVRDVMAAQQFAAEQDRKEYAHG